MFDGFARLQIETPGASIAAVRGGSGPPLLLLHGFPQTRACWAPVAGQLAERFTVIAADLRGYGESGKPASAPDHATYSFRAMAEDQVEVMRQLGFERFAVLGHDRGARVTHRMLLDHPAAITRAGVLDILPTRHVYSHVDRRLATAYYHWFFYLQPEPVPERLIAGDPIGYLHSLLGGWGGSGLDHLDPQALASYEAAFVDPAARHAMLEDYRAAASLDLEHDEADWAAGRRVEVPLLVLWGSRGVVGGSPIDPGEVWRAYATDVHPACVEAGHFLIEECPAATLQVLSGFLER